MTCLSSALTATAYTFKSGNFYYNILTNTSSSRTVEVTNSGGTNGTAADYPNSSYSVPSTVTYNGYTYTVTAIGDYAFANYEAGYDVSNFTSMTLPNTITSIGQGAFQRTGISSITLPSSLTTIGEGAFYRCLNSNFTTITIPNSVTSIGPSAFSNCWFLQKVTLGSGITSIPDYCFNECNDLWEVTIGSGVTSIGSHAFQHCARHYEDGQYYYSLLYIYCKSVTPPTIQSNTFDTGHYTTGIVVVPGPYAKSLYEAAPYWSNFRNSNGQSRISVDYPYDFAVDNIYYLLTGTNTVSVIYQWDYLENGMVNYVGDVFVPEQVKYNSTTYNVTGVASRAFSEQPMENKGAVNGEDQTRANQYHVESVVLPNNVTTMGMAFNYDNYLHTVDIGTGVTSISGGSVKCDALKTVVCRATTPPTLSSGFSNYTGATLYVPSSAVNAYKAATNWKNFPTIKALPTLNEALTVNGDGNITFTSTGSYPWKTMVYDGSFYAMSSNNSVHSSSSTLTATVSVPAGGATLSFDFKAWGEGTSYDKCIFSIDGVQQFSYGARDNDWETYRSDELSEGTHTLTWTYTKDSSVNKKGDYFAVRNVKLDLEAYVVYTPSNTTLTFYYDGAIQYHEGSLYLLNEGYDSPEWYTDGTYANVTKVVFDPSFANARPTSTRQWFTMMSKLTSITGLTYLNTENVKNMSYMFNECKKLTNLDLSNFNTAKVTTMLNMFYGCTNLMAIYAGDGWTTNAVTSSTNMFYACTKLVGSRGTTYNYNHIDKAYAHIDGGYSNPGYLCDLKEAYVCYTPSNTTLTFYCDNQRCSRTGTIYHLQEASIAPDWFADSTCRSVTKVVFDPSFANARPTSTHAWFWKMSNLTSITGISYLNTEDVTTMYYMFNGCSKLTSLDLSGFNTAKVTTMLNMFYGCTNLTTIYAGDGWTTNAVTYSTEMFKNCTKLVGGQGTTYSSSHTDKAYAHIDGGYSNPGYFTEWAEAYACYTPSNTTLTFYYDNLRSTRTGTTYDLNDANSNPGWRTDSTCFNVTKVVFNSSFANARPISTRSWFSNMTNLTSITGISYLNTEDVTYMGSMFYKCSKLTSLDVSNFNTAKVTTMGSMFYGCSSLTSLDVSHFNTAKVTSMYTMFYQCSKLTSLDVSNFNTANVTAMSYMFSGCSGLTSLDVSNFNTAKVTTMSRMFNGCSKLTSLDVSNFNTSKVTDMAYMFYGCTNLTTIYAGSGWTTNAVTSSNYMFTNCTKLVGGQGTTYDSSHTDKAYAHIDGGTSNPGYFTDKNAGLTGDVDGNGSVTIADVTLLIDILLNNINASAAADVNGDGFVTIADVTALIDMLLSN